MHKPFHYTDNPAKMPPLRTLKTPQPVMPKMPAMPQNMSARMPARAQQAVERAQGLGASIVKRVHKKLGL